MYYLCITNIGIAFTAKPGSKLKMKVLDKNQIKQKIKRLAIQIYENNFGEKRIILAGINTSGMRFAKLLKKELEKVTTITIEITQLKLNPADPLATDVSIGLPLEELNDQVIIIVDDVANTGRTVFYATKPLLEIVPRKVEVAVLVDRKHKSFPVYVDYVGLSLATTLQENIDVQIESRADWAVFID